jgi:hypothetical protein
VFTWLSFSLAPQLAVYPKLFPLKFINELRHNKTRSSALTLEC